ncbi:MAG TPA: hypothetical protein DDZ40_05910 [Deltaproteobacteria bacterium]|nr:hypothetical protein [Deltaproteobacteria bacterium]
MKKEVMGMKYFSLIMVVIGVLILAGCKAKEEPAKTEKPATVEEVKKEAGEAVQKATAYTTQQMDEYRKQAEAKLKDYDKKIDELQARAEKMKKEARAEFDEQMSELKKKREAASKKQEELQTASGKAWEDVKSGLDSAMDDMEKAYREAAARFK